VIILQGGFELDYEILKSLKFTSQFNGEYYTWKIIILKILEIWLLEILAEMSQYNPTANVNIDKGRNQYFNWNLSNYFTM
jgi:hypothetical protein